MSNEESSKHSQPKSLTCVSSIESGLKPRRDDPARDCKENSADPFCTGKGHAEAGKKWCYPVP